MKAEKITRYQYLVERMELLYKAAWDCKCPKLTEALTRKARALKDKALASWATYEPMTRRAHQLETCLEALA